MTSSPTAVGPPPFEILQSQLTNRDRSLRWYSKEIKQLSTQARELLEKYSKIPPEEVESHVFTVREKAWDIWPYPCIGQFRFLDLFLSQSPHYPNILSRLKTGNETYLDLGCCFGQDIRKLTYDGAPSEKLYGCDLQPEFLDCGFDLFRDRESIKTTFFQADIFDTQSELGQLDGKIDIVYIGSFLHLFGYSQQVEICVRIVELLKDKEGSMVLGKQVGDDKPGEYAHGTDLGGKVMRHDEESFRKMWDEIGKLTGTKWRVEAKLTPPEHTGVPNTLEKLQGDEALPAKAVGLNMSRIVFAVFREAVDTLA